MLASLHDRGDVDDLSGQLIVPVLHPVNKSGSFCPRFLPTQPLDCDRDARKFISRSMAAAMQGQLLTLHELCRLNARRVFS